jgi:hypothetical protein
MIPGIHPEVLFAVGYALFLGAVAALLESLARHSHRRSQSYANAGFVFFQDRDLWECPAGRQLTRADVDYSHNIVYYRAPASACNTCVLKSNCTDSEEGRLLTHRPDSWLESELRRFHRGISLALLVLAVLILVVEAVRFSGPRNLLALGIVLIPSSVAASRLCAALRTPDVS